MAFFNKKTQPTSVSTVDDLTVEELEFLLRLLKTAMIRGDQVELFYDMAIKLQTQYTKLQNK